MPLPDASVSGFEYLCKINEMLSLYDKFSGRPGLIVHLQ